MPRFAANLTTMFNEWPFLDRFGAAADAGFSAVEFLFPYDHPPSLIATQLRRNQLVLALFNMPPGNWAVGERGLAALPDRFDEFRAGVDAALPYLDATGATRIHMMAGIADPCLHSARASYARAIDHAAARLADVGAELLIEPINGRDMPGYFLNDFAHAEAIINDLGHGNVRLQFDIYHRQILHGDVSTALGLLMPLIGHVQIAGVPSRHEPDIGELDCRFLFAELDRLNYKGFVGCEYRPMNGTLEGLSWLSPTGASA